MAESWVAGWVLSRGAAEPVPRDWGLTVDVGQVTQVTRYVITRPEESSVRRVAAEGAVPGHWIKVFAEQSSIGPWLGPGWRVDEPGHLMTTRVTGRAPGGPPDGYHRRSWTRQGVTRVLLTAPDGAFAARGQVAVRGRTAVVDQIETGAAHRRRGLGSHVLGVLDAAAHHGGADRAVLGASPEGRELYTSLGWEVRAPLSSYVFKGPAEARGLTEPKGPAEATRGT
ncbi:GNAT family N-acetyltransferase [Streptomyces sp. NPDC050560]|uniref:GNAT family N-acetyltransferase n=1 Tax=Streptomyces sp. NPDC050560 TaxID=3365630 RepID=UPI003788FB0E